jgi:hypothetical protein
MMRRRLAAGIGVVILIVIVIAIGAAVKSSKASALQEYNREVDKIGHVSQEHISKSFFSALEGATSKEQLDIENKVDELRTQAEGLSSRASALGVPGSMVEAQRNLLLALDLRSEALAKIARLVRTAAGDQAGNSNTQIAGDMEIFLASDVLWSQRIAPLIDEALKAGGEGAAKAQVSRFLPDLGWLDAETVLARISGKGSSAEEAVGAGTHGDQLLGVTVGETTLEEEPAVNSISGGANPTFTVSVQDSGENTETNVKVEVTVSNGGKKVTASHSIDTIEAGQTVNVDIPVTGVPLGVASKVFVKIDPVSGEENTENNEASYNAVFE